MSAYATLLFGTGARGDCFSEHAKRWQRGEEAIITYFKYDGVQEALARLSRPLVFATPQLLVAENYWRARANGDALAAVHLGEKLGYAEADCHVTDISGIIDRFIASLPPAGSLVPADQLFLFGGVILFQDQSRMYQTCMTSGGSIGRGSREAAERFITSYRLKHELREEVLGYALVMREVLFDELITGYACRLPCTFH